MKEKFCRHRLRSSFAGEKAALSGLTDNYLYRLRNGRLSLEAEVNKRFKQVHLEITTLCNLSCSFCPKTVRSPYRITVQQFENRLKKIVPMADLIYLHLMGEPLSHPDLAEFLGTAEKLSAPIGITTNGTLIHEKIAELSSPAVRQLNVSFHAFDSPEKTAICSDSVLAIAEKNPALYINLRLWMSDDSADFESDPIVSVIMEKFSITPEIFSEHRLGNRSSRKIRGNIYLHFDRPFDWPGSAEPDSCGTCHALHTQFGILTDGTVVPCCLDSRGEIALGNCDTDSPESILGSPRAKKMRGGFTRGEMIEELCRKCGYAQDRFGQKKQVVTRRAAATAANIRAHLQ